MPLPNRQLRKNCSPDATSQGTDCRAGSSENQALPALHTSGLHCRTGSPFPGRIDAPPLRAVKAGLANCVTVTISLPAQPSTVTPIHLTMFLYDALETFLSTVFGWVAGKDASTRLKIAAEWIYPLQDPLTQRSRRTRLFLRSLVYASTTAQWLEFLFAQATTQAVARLNHDLVEKIHRPYMLKRLDGNERYKLLRAHYQNGQLKPSHKLLVAATVKKFLLAQISGKSGKPYQITLGPAGSFQKEGELKLGLEQDDKTLLALAFTSGTSDHRPAFLIGCLQGNPDEGNRDAIKEATKEMHGLRPRKLLLAALQALAAAHGTGSILAVSDRQHVYRHWRKRREIFQSYDAMWSDLDGAEGPDGLFELPAKLEQKPLTEYPSNKRSGIAKRNALEQQVFVDIEGAVSVLANSSDV